MVRTGGSPRGRALTETLAAKCGLHRNYVGALERGERNVALLNICRLAQALNCQPADLLGGVEGVEAKTLGE
ncbi:helix-turn-helix transcriptional regulator [Candidatus Amarobacter glycogenicus]|uniref:helix-turn-helix domain-containing protein n=1 Tax=Candidatus Amarobacter glycogenicus TaxID=3140699 RepID=UPI0031CC450A